MEEDAQTHERAENAGIQLGRLDFLIVNAAATAFKPLLAEATQPDANIQSECRRFRRCGGRSEQIHGRRRPHSDDFQNRLNAALPGHGVLRAAQAAMAAMLRDFPFELGPRRITVTELNSAMIDSDSSRICFGDDFAHVSKVIAARTTLKRLPELEEILRSPLCRAPGGRLSHARRPSRWTAG